MIVVMIVCCFPMEPLPPPSAVKELPNSLYKNWEGGMPSFCYVSILTCFFLNTVRDEVCEWLALLAARYAFQQAVSWNKGCFWRDFLKM